MEKGREKMATIKKLELKRQIQKRDRTNSKFVATAGQTIKDQQILSTQKMTLSVPKRKKQKPFVNQNQGKSPPNQCLATQKWLFSHIKLAPVAL